MKSKNHLLIFLLTFCIGFAPLQISWAGKLDHAHSMSTMCPDCDRDGNNSAELCNGAKCAMVFGGCANSSSGNVLLLQPWAPIEPIPQAYYFSQVASRYQSYADFPVYHPPIA